jgi:hypothetical protein
MGLLDDLQVRADRIRLDGQQRQRDYQRQQDYYEAELKPVMLLAYEYFSKLIENLNLVKPKITASYPLNPENTAGISLNQTDYEFIFDHGEKPHQLDIRCVCTLDRPVEFFVPSKTAVLNHSELLDDYRFFYHRRDRRDQKHDVSGATFTLEGPMPVHIRMEANPADQCVYVHLRNLEHQPYKRYKFPAEKVDPALLERIAKVLIREESQLVEVEVSDDFRSDLRRRLEIENRRKEEELARAYAEIEAEKQAALEAKPSYRAKKALQGKSRELDAKLRARLSDLYVRLQKYKNRKPPL